MRALVLLLAILFSTSAYADLERTVESAVTSDTLGVKSGTMFVPSTVTRYTRTISLKNANHDNVGIMYKASSSGTISVKVEPLFSYQVSTDENYTGSDTSFIPADSGTFTASDNSWHAVTLDTVSMPYMRFRMTGTGSNSTSTTIQIKVGKN